MSRFYHIDSSRMTHGEYWWGTKSPVVLVAWMLKWFRVQIPSSTDDPNVDSTMPFVVEALPPEISLRFQPLATELAKLGFFDVVYHVIADAGTSTIIYWATYRHISGQHLARIHHRVWHGARNPDRGVFPLFLTAFTDGAWLVSSAGKPDTLAPETVQMNRMQGAPVGKLWDEHQKLVAGAQKSIAPLATRDELAEATERHHVLLRDFHLARGAFRVRNASQTAGAAQAQAAMDKAAADGMEHGVVLAELAKLQAQKPGWGNAVWLLIGSIIAFFSVGAAQWDWKTTLWLIPILLFHEAGHWVAMRLCRYQNMRMFFIPFFGAAVIGQNWNVPGWKKALVSLAGPVPGIAVGVALGINGMINSVPWMIQASWMLLLLNGFNLLPFLPLDGGHVLHATLFCRNRWLDGIFRVLAVACLLLLSISGLGRLFLFLGIMFAIGLPVAFKLAKITDELRKQPDLNLVDESGAVVPGSAQMVIARLKTELPKGVNDKAIAQHTLNVVETLNARPPGVWATLGLLGIHVTAFLTVVVMTIVLTVSRQGSLRDFVAAAVRQPEHTVEPAKIKHWAGTQSADTGIHNRVVTTFPRQPDAQKAFEDLTGKLPPPASLMLFGDSLVLSLPAGDDTARERWYNQFHKQDSNAFVALTNLPVDCSLMFLATNGAAATNLAVELHNYLWVAGRMETLAPPWSPAAAQAEFQAARLARTIWHHIEEETSKVHEDPALEGYGRRFFEASRRGASEELARLKQEQSERLKHVQDQLVAKLRSEPARQMDPALLDLYLQLDALPRSNRAERAAIYRKVAGRLGEQPQDGSSARAGAGLGASFGHASAHGLLVEATLAVREPAVALPALVKWLESRGCTSFKYDLQPSFTGSYNPYADDSEP
jgi:Zn-dependent protease